MGFNTDNFLCYEIFTIIFFIYLLELKIQIFKLLILLLFFLQKHYIEFHNFFKSFCIRLSVKFFYHIILYKTEF